MDTGTIILWSLAVWKGLELLLYGIDRFHDDIGTIYTKE